MQEAQRVENINRLIDGIEEIGPGSAFERFGAKFLDHHLGVGLVHRGLNVELSPVKGTVDSVNDSGTAAAEYSIEKNYFQARWQKPTNDILHVVRNHTNVKDIYLISSQCESAGDVKAAVERVGAWPGFAKRTIHFYGARRISEVILDELLLDDAAVAALAEHLPVLGRVLNEAKATLAVPAVDPRRVTLKAVEEAISQRLTDENPVLAISGIAGSGKSDAAAAYVANNLNQYQTPMWVEGADLSTVADLKAARLWRGGADLNVAGMLRTRRCLLIIDDLPPSIQLSELKPLCSPGSHVLVTRRAVEKGDIAIPALTSPEAREILDRDVEETCPDEVLDTLMNTLGGHPLSLALINKAVFNGCSWGDISEDCDFIAELPDGHARLADRILGRLKSILGSELAVFEWIGQPTCDRRFLRQLIRVPGMIKIGGQGLLAADRQSIVRLHDIVFASLKPLHWLSREREQQLNELLYSHLADLISEESMALRVFATTMRSKLEKLQKAHGHHPEVLIALLDIWRPDELDAAAVGSPEKHLYALEAKGSPAGYAEVRFILEAVEGLYRFDKKCDPDKKKFSEAKSKLEARLPLFERLLALKDLPAESYLEIRHHWGKALKILGHIDKAKAQFEAVMAVSPMNSTRLQLVRLHANEKRGGELADEILTEAHKPRTVANSVVLGVVENLSWAKGEWLVTLSAKHGDLIEREILAAAEEGLEQAYGALASIGRHWSWKDPARLAKVANRVSMPSVDVVDGRTAAALGEILGKVAKAQAGAGRDLQEKAVNFFRTITDPDDFVLQKFAEVLIDMTEYSEAKAVLNRIEKVGDKPFAAYRLSQAKLHLDEDEEAMNLINAAIAALQPSHQRFKSAFLAHRYEVRLKQSDPKATDDLDEAIGCCEDDKYRSHLKFIREQST